VAGLAFFIQQSFFLDFRIFIVLTVFGGFATKALRLEGYFFWWFYDFFLIAQSRQGAKFFLFGRVFLFCDWSFLSKLLP
jgi:hypothetical protein